MQYAGQPLHVDTGRQHQPDFEMFRPANHFFVSVDPPCESDGNAPLQISHWSLQTPVRRYALPNTEAVGSQRSDCEWIGTMGEPWAARGAEGASTRLPLVLTALWAVAVVLELAYVMVLGPGPPPLGPLARALQLALAAYQLLNLLGNVGLFLRSDPSIRGVMLAGRGLGQGWA